ncbi:MAG: hypothetical protein IIA98_03940 [Proteobacteria bacterium]|nr:hypothetical protein [Pseudomonadota bacterium]
MGVYSRNWKKRKEQAAFEIWAGRQNWLRAGLMVKDDQDIPVTSWLERHVADGLPKPKNISDGPSAQVREIEE